ncbi:hypothetical protein WDU94_013324 [Cyamophila willieti]
MIAASELQEYDPFGRQIIQNHVCEASASPPVQMVLPESFLAHQFSRFAIDDPASERWFLRENEDGYEQELYIKGKCVLISKGNVNSSVTSLSVGSVGRNLVCSYCMDSEVKHALWTNFYNRSEEKGSKPEENLCIVDSTKINVFNTKGEIFYTPLQFKISSVWSIKQGLLLERFSSSQGDKLSVSELPTLFSLLHPLDEIAPLLIKKQNGMVSFMNETNMKIVATFQEPSICLLYDKKTGTHSVWRVRSPTTEEKSAMARTDYSVSNTSFGSFSSMSNLSNMSAFRSSMSSTSSMFGTNNKSFIESQVSPVPNRYSSPKNMSGSLNISNKPCNSVLKPFLSNKLQTSLLNSSTALSGSDIRLGMSQAYEAGVEPIVPDICLEYAWTDTLHKSGEILRPASKVFFSTDFIDQKFLCYVIAEQDKLFCSKVTQNNENSGLLIFGNTTVIEAKDAVFLAKLNMTAVLNESNGVVLYSGVTYVGKLLVNGISSALATPVNLGRNTTFEKRNSLLSSTVVDDSLSEAFSDNYIPLSPVTPANKHFKSNSNIKTNSTLQTLQALRDPVADKFTLVYSNNSMYKLSLPPLSSSALVTKCLNTLKIILLKDVALNVLISWYTARNAPGPHDISPEQEWNLFVQVLLKAIGYRGQTITSLSFHPCLASETPVAPKKTRLSESGTPEDYAYLLKSKMCKNFLLKYQRTQVLSEQYNGTESELDINTSAILYPSLYSILFSFHLLYEEIKLDSLLLDTLPMLVRLLYVLCVDFDMKEYAHHYWLDYPYLCKRTNERKPFKHSLNMPAYVEPSPPNIFKHLYQIVKQTPNSLYPFINKVNNRSRDLIQLFGMLRKISSPLVKPVFIPGVKNTMWPDTGFKFECSDKSPSERAIQYMVQMNITRYELQTLPPGVALFLSDAIYQIREKPPIDWNENAYRLILRPDLAYQAAIPTDIESIKVFDTIHKDCSSWCEIESGNIPYESRWHDKMPEISRGDSNEDDEDDEDDGMCGMDQEVLKLRWNEDRRLSDVRRFLQSSAPVTINITQRPEVSDHEFIEEQEKHLYTICTRTMALPLGRGMFTLRTMMPVVTEPLPIPKLCLTGKAPPRGTTVDLSHIDVAPNMNLWPLFHNGVAAGLRISPYAADIFSTWILYNKPKGGPEVLPEHAGFLMALGLNGHLSSIPELYIYEYLIRSQEMTSVGLLLGLAAAKRGTMDTGITKMLSIHIESLLPPTSLELDIMHNVQVAALLGIGLVYQGTGHRHIAEVLLSEIGRPPGPEMENSVDRESYALSAGLGLGMVVLGKGSDQVGLSDLHLPDTLHYFMIGGNKRPLTGSQKEKYKSPSYQIREGDSVNIDITAPAATIALGLMYFKTGNRAVADWMNAPNTQYLLDFVCPDFLMLRMIARGLILWDDVMPTVEWVESHIPSTIIPYCLRKPRANCVEDESVDFETMNQAYCNIVAGACMAMGLRFAGSANKHAYNVLLNYCNLFTSLSAKSIAELAGKFTIETCLNVILLSLAMVMSGTGDLEVLRVCRFLRTRVESRPPLSSVISYGSYVAVHMALGLLFLGGGMYTLSTSPPAIAALVTAFFPKFPTHSLDNRFHLQALRHLYVLAVEPRLLIPRDIDCGNLCYAHITVVYLNKEQFTAKAPCLLPELDLLEEIRINDKRYWPITFQRNRNWRQLQHLLLGQKCIDIKQRTGCLSYLEDPHGYKTMLAHTLTINKTIAWSVLEESIFSFSSDPAIIKFTESFFNVMNVGSKNEYESKLLIKVIYESLIRDKLTIVPIWLSIIEALSRLPAPLSSYEVWQIKLLQVKVKSAREMTGNELVAADMALSITHKVEQCLEEWRRERGLSLESCLDASPNDAVFESMKATFLLFHDELNNNRLFQKLNRTKRDQPSPQV